MPKTSSLEFTDNEEANQLLASSPLALLIGMLLDQQIKMEQAFLGPYRLGARLGGLDVDAIATMPPDELIELFRGPPALHRFPANMAKRTKALCEMIVTDYRSTPESIWTEADDGLDLYTRLRALPGFGEAKARIFVGILGKRLGIRPTGWYEQAADWASVADIESFADVGILREKKRAMKSGSS